MTSKRSLNRCSSYDVTLSVIVPTYNERENIPELIDRIESSLKSMNFELIIVDDNSPDGTAEVAEKLNTKYGNIEVVKRPGKFGLGSAVSDGFRKAEGEVLAVMDADLQHPPELLPEMFEKIMQGYDLVVASRYVEGGNIEGFSLWRRIISKGAMIFAHLLLPMTRGVRDVTSGYFMLKRSVIEGIRLNSLSYKILLEILVKGRHSSIVEAAYTFGSRRRGKSKLGLKEIWEYLVHIYRLLRDLGEDKRFLKFCAVGLSGIFVNELFLWLFTEFVGLFYLLSAVFATEISILSNFYFNEVWTFRKQAKDLSFKGILRRIFMFNWTRAAGILLTLFILFVLSSLLGIHYLISNLIAIMAGTAWNYFTSIHLVWMVS